jgi:amino acid permease
MNSRQSLEEIELNEVDVRPAPVKKPGNPFIRFAHSFGQRKRPVIDVSRPVEGDTSPLNRSLKGRHLQFIAIGGSIGAGLFIGCGKALATGGPASLLTAFTVVGAMLFCVMHALGELAAIYPISGIISSRHV